MQIHFGNLLHTLQYGFLNNNEVDKMLRVSLSVRVDNYNDLITDDDDEIFNKFDVRYFEILVWQPSNYKKCFSYEQTNENYNPFVFSTDKLLDWKICGDHDSCWNDVIDCDIRKAEQELIDSLRKNENDHISVHHSIEDIELINVLQVELYDRHVKNSTRIRFNKHQPEIENSFYI